MHSSVIFPGMQPKQVRFSGTAKVPSPSSAPGNSDTTLPPVESGDGSLKVAGKKRKRDIRTLDVFKSTVYGEKGLPRWHGMVCRNPVLMYPPAGISEAREKYLKYEAQQAALKAAHHDPAADASPSPTENDIGRLLTEANTDDELMMLFQEARARERQAEAEEPEPKPLYMDITPAEREIANYHHTQLDSLIRLFYEFNHVTFMKMPVAETLNQLARCGREAAAHLTEFEMQQRMARERKLEALRELRKEETTLRIRQEQLQQLSEEQAHEAEAQRNEDITKELEYREQLLQEEERKDAETENALTVSEKVKIEKTEEDDAGPSLIAP